MEKQEREKHSDFVRMLEDMIEAPDHKKGKILTQFAEVLTRYDHIRLGLAVWNQALQHFIRDGDKRVEVLCRVDIGAVFEETGDLDKAREALQEALNICDELKNDVWVGSIRREILLFLQHLRLIG